ncbi:hypothetical protein JD844_011181 [Phrynosoma platyrhinos]|uniref:rhomboid protease n=1 Tax=Phrynosoma platyrhinos TaxID=52577 RepID=A0ABQ7THZ6_PHRPL|nr:hypothetical protein JD844_011181 [Phrynosoma platyrhinos]
MVHGLQVAFFLYNGVVLDRFVLQVTHPLYLKNSLLYHPQLRAQAWRYLTYIFMHAGIEHLGLNVVLQLLVGVPLEMVHGAARIGFVYIAGVLAAASDCGNEMLKMKKDRGRIAFSLEELNSFGRHCKKRSQIENMLFLPANYFTA